MEVRSIFKKFKKRYLLCFCVIFFFSSPSVSVYANTIKNNKLSKIVEKKEQRVRKINDLYNKRQDLYSEYVNKMLWIEKLKN